MRLRILHLDKDTRRNLLEELLKRSPNHYGKYEQSVNEILEEVKLRRDAAVFEYTKRFDKAKIDATNIRVTSFEELCIISKATMKSSARQAGLTVNRTELS